MTSIDTRAFAGSTRQFSITIPDSVTSIGEGAFECCRGLTSITIPGSVTNIYGAFGGCSGLTSIAFGDSNDPLLNAGIHFLPVPNLVLPSELTKIESEAFAGLPQNSIVYIPDSVTSIAEDAFDEGTIIVTPEGSPAAEWADTNGFEYYEQ